MVKSFLDYGWQKQAAMNINIFGLKKKKSKYEYKYILVEKKGQKQILIQIFGLVFANTNISMNTNTCQILYQLYPLYPL